MKKIVIVVLFLFFCSGCLETFVRDETFLTTAIETIETLAIANTASAPVNPFAVPIGIGLTGIVAMLEALRRKEKASRKHAETKLNASGKT